MEDFAKKMMTYTYISLAVTSVVLLITALWRVRLDWKKVTHVFLLLFVATVIFDNLIIAAGLVDYDYDKTLGLKIGLAPVEDFFYTFVVALFVPYLWEKGSRRGKN